MKKVIRIASFFIKLLTAYVLAFFVKLFVPKMRQIWIISERGDDARDNGYFFFKYLRNCHPEQKVVYVIKRTSPDYAKVAKIGQVVEYNSFRHYFYFALTNIRISSSVWGGDIPLADYYKKLTRASQSSKRNVFLQHGITKDYQPGLQYPNIKPSLFVCGAKPEYDYIASNFKHPRGVVQYTGFARFDNLHNHTESQQILVMPTFRKWLQGNPPEEFMQSEYFHTWNSFLNSSQLKNFLSETGMKLIFYPHYELQKYVACFKNNCENIIIADFAHYDVQQLLTESKLLITDFSSVFFDFAYMEKPVIYYQFDRKRYIEQHYDFTKGYFDYDTMGFGEVVYTTDALMNSINRIKNHSYRLNEEYKKRVQHFFPIRDMKNCERIYDKICKL